MFLLDVDNAPLDPEGRLIGARKLKKINKSYEGEWRTFAAVTTAA